MTDDEAAWFAPKRFGYGSGFPLRWQGWALLAGYVALLYPISLLDRQPGAAARITALLLFAATTTGLALVARRKTRGGWKWRWGGKD